MTSPTALRAAHLTVFRFVAALIVVIFHYGRVATGQNGFLAAGPQMVTFFFVLSGFVMVLAYGGAGTVPARGYWRARAVRILPAYYLALLAAVFIARWQHRQVGWPPFGLSLGLLQAWWPEYVTRINPPGWSLSVEALFYLLFPALLLYSNRRKPGDWIGPALGFWLLSQSLLLMVLLTGEDPRPGGWAGNLVLYNPLAHLCSFVLGMAAGLKYRTLGTDALGRPGQALLILVSLVMVCCVGSESLFHGHDRTMPIYAASFWAPLFALWILLMAQV
ncbi:MAG: acyltransferase, partial [Stagnimonas sp.]|nr:acyltransferase [Stagnimonas sp.]